MGQDKKTARNRISKRNTTSSNAVKQRKNIFQLVKGDSIYKALPEIHSQIRDKFIFAENLISFLKEKHNEELESLSFNPIKDDINTLINSLINTIIRLGYIIVFDNYNQDNTDLKILYSIGDMEFMWYLIEYKKINNIESEEIRIGFTYLLDRIATQTEAYPDVFQYEYFQEDDNCFQGEFEMLFDEERFADEEDNIDEGMLQEMQEEKKEELARLRKWKDLYTLYFYQSYDRFLEYVPKNKDEEEFKEFIIKGMAIDYSIPNKFMDGEDISSDGGISFSQNTMVSFDFSQGVEEQWFEMMEEYGYNGSSQPVGWYEVSKEGVVNKTSQQDITDLKAIYQYILDLYENHLNKLEK
jgi:hypothetical protein